MNQNSFFISAIYIMHPPPTTHEPIFYVLKEKTFDYISVKNISNKKIKISEIVKVFLKVFFSFISKKMDLQ